MFSLRNRAPPLKTDCLKNVSIRSKMDENRIAIQIFFEL